MITMEELIVTARKKHASDIHISEGMSMTIRVWGKLQDAMFQLSEEETRNIIYSTLTDHQRAIYEMGADLDFSIQTGDGNRQRVNVFHQQGKMAATIRLLDAYIPSLEELHLPTILTTLAEQPRGLILVTGPTGSGKSTTLASMIDYINHQRAEHILTIEDPIEYVYTQERSLIHQREVGLDVKDFASALRSALREDPDVILVGEMRDYETISAALTAAETGHLVLSTLHTTGAAQTIDRIVDACPTNSQGQIRTQLSGILKGVITQTLIPTVTGEGRIPATEVLIGSDAVLNLIRENKCYQMNTMMQSGMSTGMHTLNGDLARLVRLGTISKENARKYSNDTKDLEQYL
ncbi:MAG: type IV pilus twitching motility protein PilT [Lachnospiraceae bacterium]